MAKAETEKIYSVDQVFVQVTRTEPPWLIIHAIGRAPTTGWSDGELSPRVYVNPPEDSIQDFDFNATIPPSDTQVLSILTLISAHAELPEVDIENYWGKGIPLKGIRVHAVANMKVVELHSRKKTVELVAKMSPQATASYVGNTDTNDIPGFEEDIRPLFRERDVIVMESLRGFNLHKYEDVKEWAERIQNRLDINMPCDGLWPQSDRDKFAAWIDGGMPA